MLPRRLACLLILACALAFSCKRKPATPPEVVVRVNERLITLADFKRYLERNTGTDLAQLTPEVSSAMLDQYVEEIVISEHAATHGVEVPAEKIAAAVRTEAGSTVIEKRDQMRREKLFSDIAAEVGEPSEAEVRAYYNDHQSEFRSGEEVRVRQILVNDEQLASQLVDQLRKGADFGALSAEHSRAPNAKRGGEIGYVGRGDLPKMFEDVIFRMQPGAVSDVIRTDSSFHIFKVEERRPAGQLDLQTADPLIRVRVKEDAIRERMAQLVAQARREMQVAVLTRRLPFKYSGSLPLAADE
jgi:peptidyl-prolyl cis-trans isomerase C